MKESNLINIVKQIVPSSAAFIGDDTAFIKDRDLILTQDTLVENVHFRLSTISPYDLGYKSVAVNLSDIAASGGVAEYILVSVSLPASIQENFVKELYTGINDICVKYGVLVVGGDTCGADSVVISITAIGKSDGVATAQRSNASVDDAVIVTGNHGSSGAGFLFLENDCKKHTNSLGISANVINKFEKAHTKPEPQLVIGRKIAQLCDKPLAMMDSSDGLADALFKIAEASNVSMSIDFNAIPHDADIETIPNIDFRSLVFYGGEDYQLVATVSAVTYQKLQEHDVEVFKIGKVIDKIAKPEVFVEFGDETMTITKESLDKNCFDHFSKNKKEGQ